MIIHFQWGCAISFWSSLFTGQDKNLDSNIKKFGGIGEFSTGMGEKNLTASSNFFNSLLSGDPSQQGKVLAPEIAGIQGQKQQTLNTNAEFHNRSGGVNASNQMEGDKAKGTITSMISQMLGGAASNLSSSGSNLLQQGVSAFQSQDEASAAQAKNWSDSILGLGVTKGIGGAEGAAMGGMGMG